jgi:stage V sporulation protein G
MAGLEVTDVKVQIVDEGRLKAFATITLNGCFVVRDVKVIDGNTGLFVAMPSRRKPDGTYRDVAHPLNSECRGYLEKCVLEAYDIEVRTGSVPVGAVEDSL